MNPRSPTFLRKGSKVTLEKGYVAFIPTFFCRPECLEAQPEKRREQEWRRCRPLVAEADAGLSGGIPGAEKLSRPHRYV